MLEKDFGCLVILCWKWLFLKGLVLFGIIERMIFYFFYRFYLVVGNICMILKSNVKRVLDMIFCRIVKVIVLYKLRR